MSILSILKNPLHEFSQNLRLNISETIHLFLQAATTFTTAPLDPLSAECACLAAEDSHQYAGNGDTYCRQQQFKDDFEQRSLKITRREGQAEVNGCEPEAEKQAGKGQCFEPHPGLGAGADKGDKERIGNRYGRQSYSCCEAD